MDSKDSLNLDSLKNLCLDDFICIYRCLDLQVSEINISCFPDTLRSYYNQIMKIQSFIHSVVLNNSNSEEYKYV